MRTEISIPDWIVAPEHAGDYFLLVLHHDGRVSVDGGHGDPLGVARAKKLYESIECIKPTLGSRFVMLRVEAVPNDVDADVNDEAIRTLNATHRANQRRRLARAK